MGTVAGTVVGKIFFLTLDYMSVNLYLCIVKKRGAGAESRPSPPPQPWHDTANFVNTYQNKRKTKIKQKNGESKTYPQ